MKNAPDLRTPAPAPAPKEVVQFIDPDVGAVGDAARPEFERVVSFVERSAEPRCVIVSSLYYLYRTRRDRERVEALMRAGKLDLTSAREDFSTEKPGGMARYRTFAELVKLAYEGEWSSVPADATRHELVDAFADGVLGVWLRAWGSADQVKPAIEDVRARLHALVERWDDPERLEPLLAPFLEIAIQHEPRELSRRLRALALVGVRNSALEDLHLEDVIIQDDWQMLTQAAAHALARIDAAKAEPRELDTDPFAGVLEDHPTATAAFTVLAEMAPGEEASWTRPDVEAPEVPSSDTPWQMTRTGYEIRHAMESAISKRLADILAQRCADQGVFAAPSFKHISRNMRTLFQIVDVLLAQGATIVTANLQLTPERIVWREDVTDYNSEDLRWTGLPGMPADMKLRVGRNDPCPCGSGLKYKRCCGR